jgi:hypothetical protein
LFIAFERESFNPWYFLACFAVVGAVSLALAWTFMDPYYVLTYRSGTSFFLAVVWNVLIGSVLIESLGNISSVVLIRLGHDPTRMIVDNILIALASVGILWYFQNSWFSITTALALGVLQGLLRKAMTWRGRGPQVDGRDGPVAAVGGAR